MNVHTRQYWHHSIKRVIQKHDDEDTENDNHVVTVIAGVHDGLLEEINNFYDDMILSKRVARLNHQAD